MKRGGSGHMFGSRNKGSRAEREVAALLAEWWRPHEPGVEFIKTPLSGGWSTPKLRGSFRASGDIMTTSQTFPFSVEVKRRENFSWDTLLAGKRSPVWEWWEQTTRAANEQMAVPMLWLRHSREPWRVVLPETFADAICSHVAARFWSRRDLSPPSAAPVAIVSARALLAVWPTVMIVGAK